MEWTKVKEKLPDKQAEYLVYSPAYGIETANWYWHQEESGGWFLTTYHHDNVTHWMPLPELPEVK